MCAYLNFSYACPYTRWCLRVHVSVHALVRTCTRARTPLGAYMLHSWCLSVHPWCLHVHPLVLTCIPLGAYMYTPWCLHVHPLVLTCTPLGAHMYTPWCSHHTRIFIYFNFFFHPSYLEPRGWCIATDSYDVPVQPSSCCCSISIHGQHASSGHSDTHAIPPSRWIHPAHLHCDRTRTVPETREKATTYR